MGVEEDLLAILNGEAVAVSSDVDLKSEYSKEDKYIPMTKTNMCYICGACIFDDSGRVLLIQEAKKSCRGTWYLPLGRLERGETLLEGAKREVKEEAGIDCELSTLLGFEMQSSTWIRFTFYGRIKDGTALKTLDQQDGESLQAKMFTLDEVRKNKSNMRAADVFKLIEAGRKYHETEEISRRPNCLPVVSPHMKLKHRVVIIDRTSNKNQAINVLVNKDQCDHIPTTLLNFSSDGHIAASVYGVLKNALGPNHKSGGATVRMCGILGVEHNGKGELEDGICLTSLVSLDLNQDAASKSAASLLPEPVSTKYQWHSLKSPDLIHRVEMAASKGHLVPML